jgi:6-phosphogluconolactonase
MNLEKVDILICRDEESASRDAAERFACAAVRSVAQRGAFYVAVSGGRTPRRMYEDLAERELAGIVPWARTELFFTDERCVGPESEESNFRMVNELLLSTVPIPESNIHRFHGEDLPQPAADRYEHEIHEVMGSSPRFDLIVLGMGEDTHTASLFPDSPALREAGRHAAANYVEKLGAYRLTLTMGIINHAQSVIILAFGSEKAQALAEVLRGPVDTNLHPVQAICPVSGHLLWIVDQAAAREL